MKASIWKEFRFEAAHQLPRLPAAHPCSRLHGHSYRIRVCVEGSVDEKTGWVTDFAELDAAVRPLIDHYLDHRYLNQIEGLENPTAENLAGWLWERIKARLPNLSEIQVQETATAGCRYRGPHH